MTKSTIKDLILPYVRNAVEGIEYTDDKSALKHFRIILDRVCYYIAKNYDSNFKYLRSLTDANKPMIRKVEQFIDDDIPYETVREYYYSNKDSFKEVHEHLSKSTSRNLTYMIKAPNGSKFLSTTLDGIELVDQEQATIVDYFLTEEMTISVVTKLLKLNGYTDDFKLVKCKFPDYHKVSEFKKSL